uniref:structural maintenance of chromosomes flexible hinge domain-containing protein 1 isoform X2 n=1 Tax=Scatophagus argus TaxID=75038 RepID=UPI001ED85E6A|nr:structural maintenance of chromosomes flexible hinge domain-containing protein 1 isoform X2 [Scatophagus argus]
MLNSGAQRPSGFVVKDARVRRIFVYDHRFGDKKERKCLETTYLKFGEFLRVVKQEFAVLSHETFVLATEDGTVLDFFKFEELQNGSNLYLLKHKDQALSLTTERCINFTPHYDTLIRSGMYEYYASEGRNPLAIAIAELVDNALSAMAKITGKRQIEIRMLFDATVGKPAVIILDNGCGMTSEQLKNWAVYRLSKFSRTEEEYVRPDHVPCSLNSDISYSGVGGKQAVFFIGDAVRMISKSAGSPKVHELVLSKEEFENKERNNEDIYSTVIKNRKPGDSSHVDTNEHSLHALIAEETHKASFTAVVITGVQTEHITFLIQKFEVWTRQLAHIYHYYIHGVPRTDKDSRSTNSDCLPKIDIQITLQEKAAKRPRMLSLKEIEDNIQALYIKAATDTFEFMASSTEPEGGIVEGIIRYHPFLYDKETYPEDPNAEQASDVDDDDDDDDESGVQHQASKKRPIFECFWNGRLIPYTTVSEFDWCAWRKDSKVPAECYNRVSGVLFTNDRFKVSMNKLTFLDLELALRKNDTLFSRIVDGQKRRNIQKEFAQWLNSCHEKWDKQIKFLGYKETITRTDVPSKKMQHPWGVFSSIKWDRKMYKKGDHVKSQKTQPILYGKVIRFLLYGNNQGDVFATGGSVELTLEPKALYDKTRIIPIYKIDQTATDEAIKEHINNDLAKLPEKLKVDWVEADPLPQNAVCPAGTALGPFNIQILNKKDEPLSRMPSVGQGPVKKLVVVFTVVHHGPQGTQEVFPPIIAQHSLKWGFVFNKTVKLEKLGKYTLYLKTAINESNVTVFGGRELPSYKLDFTIEAGKAEIFAASAVSSPLRVGVPFDIPLLIRDGYGHPAIPPPNLKPVLQCSGLDLSYEEVDSKGATFTIRNVKAIGKVLNQQSYSLKVTLSGLTKDTQNISIVLLPGKPHSLHVKPESSPISAENGNPISFHAEIHDKAGNIATNPKQVIRCQVQGLPLVETDCSSTGAGQLVTKPINLKIINGEPQKLKVQFDMPSHRNVASVVRELLVLPSSRVSSLELYSQNDKNLVLRNKEKIEWLAGGSLENLFYRLYDEAGKEVPLTAGIASKIKVNWTADVNLENLFQGKLPDIQVPTQVKDEHFYQVSYQDQSVSVSFDIVPLPNEPTRLKATLLQNTVKLGETLPEISLELVDQYDNVTKVLTSTCVNHMSVEAEGVDNSAVSFTWQESSRSVLVTGIRFRSGTPGSREMCFTYGSYVERVLVKVTAGAPAQLKVVSKPEEPLQVLNGRGIATPFLIQLCDEWGNPSPDQSVVVELKSSPPTLKLKTSVTSQPVNADGTASFTVNGVSGPKGYYQLVFKGSFNNRSIPGPSVNLTVIPDPNKPASLLVEYDTTAKCPAGGKFPVFTVTVLSDEGSPIRNFDPAAASMFLWQGALAATMPPPTATELKCSKPMENERHDRLYFRDKEIPKQVGQYSVQFSLRVDKTEVLFSNQIPIYVLANQPVKLGPDSLPCTPVVSYTRNLTDRTLVESMTLRIRDSYGNPAGQDLDGKVKVYIKNSSGDNNANLPLFEDKISSFDFILVEGNTHITRLAIMENSPGENGSSYILLFKPEVPMVSTPLLPFELLFHFYNDVDNQRKVSELTKIKDELTTTVAAYKNTFAAYSALLQLLTSQHLEASRKEAEKRRTLSMKNVEIAESVSIADVDRLLTEKTTEADRILSMSRRVCTIRDQFRGQPDVLGTVGHLAFVEDDAAAWVISWHISGDMDCVVTKTTAAARRIYDDTRCNQQVMALDNVYVHPMNRPLPHIRNGQPLFDPPGNPIYARELLICPRDKKSCKTVFKKVLGDTILIDDLDSANSYRKAVVQNKIPCPTILTRQGDRISAKGEFGAHNKAPPMNKLQVFAAPRPQSYYTLQEQIDLLKLYRSVLQKRDAAAQEHEDHLQKMNSPETLKMHREMEGKEKQLEAIERQVSSSVRPVKRGPEDAGEPSGIFTKRAKQ